ncbi:TPA: ParA family protein [Candidatus Bathyarchaeota archaeon]|nr:ParA family protein [Candidatus Bathyarchaeota archaeon]
MKDNLNSKLEILGFLLTMYDRRERITTDVEDILREQFGDGVFNTVIRINTKFKAAPSEQKTIFQYEKRKDGRGTSDYERLTTEVLSRLFG